MIRTLLFSTLYPSSVRPGHGIFVETRLRHLLAQGAQAGRREGLRGAWAVRVEVGVQGGFGAFDHRPDRPQGVVEIEADGA